MLGSTKCKGATEGSSGLAHRTVRCATGHVRCTRGLRFQTHHLREFLRGHSAIIHRTVRCAPDMSGAPRKGGPRNSPASGFHSSRSSIIHRTVRCAPDCPVCTGLSGVHRTVRCICGATATSGANGYLQRIKCAPARAEVRHAHAGAPDTLQFMSGVPPDIKTGPASELQRSEP